MKRKSPHMINVSGSKKLLNLSGSAGHLSYEERHL